jgi:hypothetical protein
MATDRKINVIDFMATRKELKAATALIDEVLAAPLFNDGFSQPALDNARQDKDLAARGFEKNEAGKYEQH